MTAINTSTQDSAVLEIQVEALVVMRIIKHATSAHPATASGFLVGMDSGAQLQVTNSFPFPASAPDHSSNQDYQSDPASSAAAAPRSKNNTQYANEMIKYLREVNTDAQGVGWYTSTSMGNFINSAFVENQLHYQKASDERTAALVFDVTRSTNGSLGLKAYRLSPKFIEAHKEGKFTAESLQKAKLRYQDILVELPVSIHNSHLLTSFLHQLPQQLPTSDNIELPPSLDDIARDPKISHNPFIPNLDALDLSIDPFLERSCDLLLDSIESHQTEQNNVQYYQRALAREQAKISAWQAKRKAENAARAASKQPLLDENEWQRLFKLPTENSRLESLLIGRQVEQYARQVDGFSATVSAKMFAVRQNLTPGEVS